jgi:hypothetical protein
MQRWPSKFTVTEACYKTVKSLVRGRSANLKLEIQTLELKAEADRDDWIRFEKRHGVIDLGLLRQNAARESAEMSRSGRFTSERKACGWVGFGVAFGAPGNAPNSAGRLKCFDLLRGTKFPPSERRRRSRLTELELSPAGDGLSGRTAKVGSAGTQARPRRYRGRGGDRSGSGGSFVRNIGLLRTRSKQTGC